MTPVGARSCGSARLLRGLLDLRRGLLDLLERAFAAAPAFDSHALGQAARGGGTLSTIAMASSVSV